MHFTAFVTFILLVAFSFSVSALPFSEREAAVSSPTPTKTYATASATSTATVTGPFKLQASTSKVYADIQYSGFEFVKFNASAPSSAVQFELQGTTLVLSGTQPPKIAYEVLSDNYGTVFFDRIGKVHGNPLLSCKIDDHVLNCTSNGWNYNALCNSFSQWRIGRRHVDMAGCDKFTPMVVPV